MRRNMYLVLCIAALLAVVAGVPAAAAPSTKDAIVARITTRSRAEIEQLAELGLDLLEFRSHDDLFIITTATEMERLRADGWQISVDEAQTALLQRAQTAATNGVGTSSFNGGYRTGAEIAATLRDRAARYPTIAEVFEYGRSYLNTPLLGVTLTNQEIEGPKPTLVIVAGVHAREIAPPEIALRFVDDLLGRYATDADAAWLLDEHQIVVVPLANPDGYRWVEQGYFQRKNGHRVGTGCADPPQPNNHYGVDINRNSSWQWGSVIGPSIGACSVLYPGDSPASEPETIALETLVRSLIPDQRITSAPAPPDTMGMLLTLHSYGNLVIWPWGYTAAAAPNSADLARIGGKFAAYNGYFPQQANAMYPMSGTTDDWSYGELGIPSYTFEIGLSEGACGGFMPPFSCLDGGTGGSFWSKNKPALLYAARIASTPYLLGRGPAPEGITVRGRTITAVLDDTANGGQAVVAAEYFADLPPWRGGTGKPLQPTDGVWNSARETVTGTVDVAFGRHMVYARGRDAAGNWGPVQAVWVDGGVATEHVWVPFSMH